MINFIKDCRFWLVVVLLLLPFVYTTAKTTTKGGVTIDYFIREDGSIYVTSATNKSGRTVSIQIDGSTVATLKPNQSTSIDKDGHKILRSDANTRGATFWRYEAPSVPKHEEKPSHVVEKSTSAIGESSQVTKESARATEREKKEPTSVSTPSMPVVSDLEPPRSMPESGFSKAMERIEGDDFFGKDATQSYIDKANSFADALSQSNNKTQFVNNNDIRSFLTESEKELNLKKTEISMVAHEAVRATRITDESTQSKLLEILIQSLNTRVSQREAAYDKLKEMVDSIPDDSVNTHPIAEIIINYSIIGVIVIVIIVWIIIAVKKRMKKINSAKQVASVKQQSVAANDNPAIIVRRRTTSVLKKQSLDDVVGNPEYLLIKTSDFTPDSAVRNIYIKSGCIRDVYNMYAEDLRDTNNPKEDGCMVVGRWVHDEDTHTYDISLETVVFPGDDAVFKEYELNFGGKIKLRIAEKLRRLRRETNLQYDLVCWIHSHPGLGVFFSNSDDNVQMQLKHSQHPNFLIAFVVDILTSTQEMGIFTFRKDGSMNSKGDLTKLYSLEEMYKWTLESDKASFSPDNYYNILKTAKLRMPSCKGIELNNSAIIDVSQIVVKPGSGIVGYAIGTSLDVEGNKEYVISSIVEADERPMAGVVGVLLNLTHMSLPTIQRIIARESSLLSFVMVYSSRQNTLTSIPIVNGELVTEEHFYGEETIDNLKIWTRRKR